MSKLTLDEAIKHCLEVAEQNEAQAEKIGRQFIGSAMDKCATNCCECAADHRQLAEWLMDYKKLRKENAELKSTLNAALKDIHGKDICEVMNACKLCAIKFQQLCDIFPWQHANEALKLIGDENDAK